MDEWEKIFLLVVIGAIAFFVWDAQSTTQNLTIGGSNSATPWWYGRPAGGTPASTVMPNHSAGQANESAAYGIIDPYYEIVQF